MSLETKQKDVSLIQMSNYVKPDIQEVVGRKWVLNGDKNWFFQYVLDRYLGSPTNESVINVFCSLIFGKGISVNGQEEIYEELNEIFNKREQKKCIADRKIFGQYAMQILRAKGGGVAKILHLPINKLAPEKADEKGNIDGVYYCYDWSNTTKYKPKRYPIFKGKMSESIMVKTVRPYNPNSIYYANPDYQSSLQYSELEEEISNFCINFIKSGMSFGYIVNFNNGGALETEQKDDIEKMIRKKLTGSSNAGKFILSFNDGKEAEVTVVQLSQNDNAHKQWESLREDAQAQIIKAHGAFPALFGIETTTGFSSNAEELDTQSKLVQDYQINPIQEEFIDELAPILELAGLETDLTFIPLRDTYKSDESEDEDVVDDSVDEEEVKENETDVKMSAEGVEILLTKGEDINYDEWDVVDDRRCDKINIKESDLNTVFEFAQVPKTSDKKSVQDTSIFKIRYRYAGNPKGERDFCNKLIKANKLFRAEDLDDNYNYNEELATTGKDSYNIFNFKGGVNCKHWWQRVIFLKKGNKSISVNNAKKMVLALDPEDRKAAKWDVNNPLVAQSASASNNYHSLKPNYRNSGIMNPKKI